MNWLAIINPRSGGGKTESELRRIRGSLQSVTRECVFTQYHGHGETLAREASSFDGIAVVGGDGTLHEVMSGLGEKQVLGIVPAGTGNSLARDLCLMQKEVALESIKEGKWAAIDLMRVSRTDPTGHSIECVSASTISLGYPTDATRTANRHFKAFGKLCYPLASTFNAVLLKRFALSVTHGRDPNRVQSLTGLIINNTRHVANFLAFPGASLMDGKIEVMELAAGRLKQLAHNLSILTHSDFCMPASIQTAPSVSVRLTRPQDLMIDGEIYPNIAKFEVRVLPRRLRCITRYRSDA